ncbi:MULTISPECIES: chemotaxis-specific protein-glutamate methyltransferase CheB [unclassified Roseofilum]|uniref:chemotaxis-specific protein-glutamate methyltransferase CheB n=1 Tax=unclassified Roseofilum TaxID=2620099 RepID=UPI000E8F1EB1|nr:MULTISPECIES: chemotaxis-specific protein-glutamate methyltransferase CheB [unclassified Roseofilum]MBP0011082.1 chemotaxis-specific protein-glutamate methyltransferase CheB [Roseofilum sp. Belize Diploria]MBP0035270.1 chemotaxis-specific protein-glutamate methyltransferase CheB [Roseofilum sp. Belize BBD 4]HBQ98992.1 chemotaxis response regulator protein-glutamate methylesterase [Cyanobacteria bacterium UBA11691]
MPIRVIIVEDSPIALTILKRMLNASPDIEVVGTARTGKEAIALIPKVDPQVICTDLHMPEMDGLTLTEEIMSTRPKPILVISSSVREQDTHQVFKVLEAGAVDVFPKPEGGLGVDSDRIQQALINKVKILAGVSVFTNRKRSPQPVNAFVPVTPTQSVVVSTPPSRFSRPKRQFRTTHLGLIALGASTGGPQVLEQILSQFPANLPVPVICVQHISEGFLQGFIDWLSNRCSLPVSIARAGDRPQPGHIYFSPERSHLIFDRMGCFVYSRTVGGGGHCPSITVTFNSVAQYYRNRSIGVLLTGMGRDGADGLLSIFQAGGFTLAQNEASCVVFGMPKEAIALGATHQVLPPEAIATAILRKLVV